jgi:3-methyladenine DNA glycosylase AlkC
MAEPFKNLINATTVDQAARALHQAWPAFPRQAFVRQAGEGLDLLEFKARAMQLADALEATLPTDFHAAADVIEASLAPPIPLDAQGEPSSLASGEARTDGVEGLSGWVVWSLAEFVARRGMGELPRALACLHALTQRFSAEFAIRPFIQRHPGPVLETLAVWVNDPSAHVRRLVSEGSRPRLPWGLRLQALVADPTPTLPLLRALQDDPSAYVRRSVANHLNDIAKDHPALVAGWLATHLPGASAERTALLRHASRGLVKAGDAAVLAAWGVGSAFCGRVALALSPTTPVLGEVLTITLDLQSNAATPQRLAIDYAVHHVKAGGHTTPKVFKGWVIDLAPGERRQLVKRHALKPVTTRRYHAGAHAVDVRINGQVLAEAGFMLAL